MARIPYSDQLAANIRAARSRRRLAQAVVVARMRALGFSSWHRQTMGNIERGDRRVTAEELFGLALALEVSIPSLTTAAEPDGLVELPSGEAIHSVSVERLAGRGLNDHAVQWPDGGTEPMFFTYTERPKGDPFDRDSMGYIMAAQGWPVQSAARPIPVEGSLEQPVVAAIVTSHLGVLVGKRNDGKPPWTFIAGKIEPGESPADAAVREVKEETTLEVRAGEMIGQRVHPKTGRRMLYMGTAPTHSTEAVVGDEAELAEVRWVSLAEADELLPGMFEPVREYLQREIGE